MLVERRERVFAIWLGATGNGRNPMINGRRQPSRGGTSRMTRECQVRFCERLGVQFPGPTRQNPNPPSRPLCQLWPAADITPLGLPPLCAKALNRYAIVAGCGSSAAFSQLEIVGNRCCLEDRGIDPQRTCCATPNWTDNDPQRH
jgi:hypothetical protein